MAKKKFIFQGFTAITHHEAVQRLFECPDIQHIIFSIAFANESGVRLLLPQIQKFASQMTVFVGIRNEITSRQGLEHLLMLGVQLYVVDTGARSPIFHPKLYFVRGKEESRFVIGSANFTMGGLRSNIEAGISFDLDFSNVPDKELADNIESEFVKLPTDYPEHIIHITSIKQLQELQDGKRLLDEAATAPPRPIAAIASPTTDGLSRIKLKVKPIARSISREILPQKPRRVKKETETTEPVAVIAPSAAALEFLWESKALTERDLTIPSGKNTHATGSINLDKGLLASDIDHRHYFRDEVFYALTWMPTNNPKVEEAFAKFRLIMRGIEYGEFDLRVGHTKDTESKAYKQKNAMTRLSWGATRNYVASKDLIGRTLSLYRDAEDPTRFLLEID